MKNEQAPFAARIKKLRIESDLTQQQLADLVGVSQTTVWSQGRAEWRQYAQVGKSVWP